jgi:hypothetical protein
MRTSQAAPEVGFGATLPSDGGWVCVAEADLRAGAGSVTCNLSLLAQFKIHQGPTARTNGMAGRDE